jgi:hypothetical protein
MGYDRQRSPFATRLFLTCYCLFLLVNILIYSNRIENAKDEKKLMIFLCLLSLILFSISFYGLWFAKILILCLIALLFSILLGTSFISMILILTNNISLKTSIYFAHNYIWVMKVSTNYLSIIYLSISSILNILALWGIYHLCSCIEHRQEYWPYRKQTTPGIINVNK